MIADGRLAKARQFRQAAEVVGDLADDEAEVRDAIVTLLVHAGIAAADAICCRRLGEYSLGGNHSEAVDLLAKVREPDGRALANRLRQLLGMKTRAGYMHQPVNAESLRKAKRAADQLLDAGAAL